MSLTIVCFECKRVVGVKGGGNGVTHTICGRCLRKSLKPVILREQAKEQQEGKGSWPCYMTPTWIIDPETQIVHCTQKDCSFYPICTRLNPGPADVAELQTRLAKRNLTVHYTQTRLEGDQISL
ncbi:MAG: hypothetical protein ACLFUU_06600 [Desulfobacteraceae bacterium]